MDDEQLWRHGDLIRRFAISGYRCPLPVVAAIHGFCLGGGLENAVACGLRLATEDASLGYTEVRIGAFPGAGGAVFTPKLVGPAIAKDLLFAGRRVSGLVGEELGLVNRAVPADGLIKHAREIAATIAANAP